MKTAAVLLMTLLCTALTAPAQHYHGQAMTLSGIRHSDTSQVRRALEGIDRALSRYPDRRFTEYYDMKYMHSDDTTHSVYHVTLQRDTASEFGFLFRGYTEFSDRKSFHVMYDGVEAVMGNPDDSLMERIPAAEDPVRNIQGTFANSACFPHIAGIKSFAALADREHVTAMTLEDSLLNGDTVMVVEINENFEDNADSEENTIARRYLRIVVRARDTIPVRISEDLDIRDPGGMLRQYRNARVENLDLHPDIPEGYFSRSSLPEYVLFQDYSDEEADRTPPLQAGTPAPEFVLPIYGGDSLRLSDLRGSVVFMDFWYQSCHPCRLAAPKIEELYEEYGRDGTVRFLGINPFDQARNSNFQRFLESRGISYPVLLDAASVADAYGVSGYPTFFIIDGKGIVRWSGVGYADGYEKVFREELEKVVGE